MKNLYVRVGTTYFKKSLYPSLNGDFIEILVVWSPELIRQDHGKNTLSEIERGKTSQIDHPIPVQIDHQFRSKLTTIFQSKLTT